MVHDPTGTSAWSAWIDERCRAIDAAGRWRSVRSFDAAGPEGLLADPGTSARQVVSFASNDYLGLSQHPAVAAAAVAAVERWGTGSGAARLIVGSRPVHHELERELAAWRGTEAALLFPTGYSANLAALTTFGGARGAHRLRRAQPRVDHRRVPGSARAEVAVYPHGRVDHVARLLDEARADGVARTIIATDTAFSMDGDLAPMPS